MGKILLSNLLATFSGKRCKKRWMHKIRKKEKGREILGIEKNISKNENDNKFYKQREQ
jgi:hypothetical protein